MKMVMTIDHDGNNDAGDDGNHDDDDVTPI